MPESNFEVLTGDRDKRGAVYRCKQCGMLFEVIEEKVLGEKRDVHFIPIDEVGWERAWIVSDKPVETKSRRVLKGVGFVVGGFLTSIPGIAIVALGVYGLLSGQFPFRSKFGGLPPTGEEAIGLSWICIGFGLWVFGQLGTFCERWPLSKMFVYVLAGGAFACGIVFLIRYMF